MGEALRESGAATPDNRIEAVGTVVARARLTGNGPAGSRESEADRMVRAGAGGAGAPEGGVGTPTGGAGVDDETRIDPAREDNGSAHNGSVHNGSAHNGRAGIWHEGGDLFTEVQVHAGLTLYLLHAGLTRPRRAELEFSERVLRFSFVLSGSRVSRCADGEAHSLRGGMMECGGASTGSCLRMELAADAAQRGVEVLMAPSVLALLLEDAAATLPDRVRAFMAGEVDGLSGCVRGMLPEQLVATRRVHDVSLQGAERNLLLMSKTLELLSLLFASHRDRSGGTGRLPAREIERLQCVRSRLVQDLDSPPSIKELARLVGLNDTKLKREFKGFFGKTVYGYFRSYRMERARELLLSGDVNISEAAVSVGYSNISHFSAAFSKHYGIKPSQFLRSVRREELLA